MHVRKDYKWIQKTTEKLEKNIFSYVKYKRLITPYIKNSRNLRRKQAKNLIEQRTKDIDRQLKKSVMKMALKPSKKCNYQLEEIKLSVIEKGVLWSLTTILDLSTFSCSFISFSSKYFEALLLGAKIFMISISFITFHIIVHISNQSYHIISFVIKWLSLSLSNGLCSILSLLI